MQITHFKTNPFTCKICGHKCTSKSNLKHHMIVHKPKTECKICHKKFSNMEKHMISHSNFNCPICNKTFTKNWINRHINMHRKSSK